MGKTETGALSITALALLIGFALACGGGGSGGDGISDGDIVDPVVATVTPDSLKAENTIDFHANFTSTDNELCISCHGDMTNGETLSATVKEFHTRKAEYMSSYKCVDCHKSVDLLQDSGGNLRKQVDVETICYPCHGDGAITQLYQ